MSGLPSVFEFKMKVIIMLLKRRGARVRLHSLLLPVIRSPWP